MGNAVRASTEVTPNLMAEFLVVLLIGDDYVSSASAAFLLSFYPTGSTSGCEASATPVSSGDIRAYA